MAPIKLILYKCYCKNFQTELCFFGGFIWRLEVEETRKYSLKLKGHMYWTEILTRLSFEYSLPTTLKWYGNLVYFQTLWHVVRSLRTDRVESTNRTKFTSIFAFVI